MTKAAVMAKPVWKGNHPVGQINAAPPFYRFCATGLGAAMWFFVRVPHGESSLRTDSSCAVVLPSEERRSSTARLETSMGSLNIPTDKSVP